MVSIAVCEKDLEYAVLAEEGKRLCGERKPCGMWFLEDAALVPEDIPNSHDLLPAETITGSRGVWMHEASRFVTIQK